MPARDNAREHSIRTRAQNFRVRHRWSDFVGAFAIAGIWVAIGLAGAGMAPVAHGDMQLDTRSNVGTHWTTVANPGDDAFAEVVGHSPNPAGTRGEGAAAAAVQLGANAALVLTDATSRQRLNEIQATDYQPAEPESPIPTPAPTPGTSGQPDPVATPGTSGQPDPVATLGLPNYNPGTLSLAETRTVYLQGELRMHQLDDRLIRQGMSPERHAQVMFAQRNALRSWTRDLMSDRRLAAQMSAENPNLTWDQIVAENQARGLTGDDLYSSIIDSSTRSRAGVNAALGIDPEHPPQLPPVRPAPR